VLCMNSAVCFMVESVIVALPPSPPHTHTPHRDQMCSVECDVVTGFHVEDWEQHVVVLEGVRGGGVRRVWEELPRHPTQGIHIC